MPNKSLFELRDARIEAPAGVVLGPLDMNIEDAAVTVLLGPAGTGKSSLLRGLSGRGSSPSIVLRGHWLYRGRDIRSCFQQPDDIVWCRQGEDAERLSWKEALDGRAATVLLDEPLRGRPESRPNELVSALRNHATRGAAVVVTHNLEFARAAADHVMLVCAGELHSSAPAASFFDSPPTELTARFLTQGNCWPASPGPALPSHFRWLEDGKLAGMGKPGLLNDVDDDLAAVASAGVTHLVTLTETPFAASKLRSFGIQARHFPIRDMGVPAMGPTARLCGEIHSVIEHGGVVAVHCHAGLGRTGTMLAAMKVWLGAPPDEAIVAVRKVNGSFIQNIQQETFIHHFSESV